MSDPSQARGGKRASADSEEAARKKSKKEDRDGSYNPYLAHMYQEEDATNGVEGAANSVLAGMKRRQTTAKQHTKAEESDSNAFTFQEHSQKYFQILETRRNLPVHKQR